MSIGPSTARDREKWIAEGQELERRRIRDELHREVSQQLLGAAFGCNLLAAKVVQIDQALGKEASDLADLLNAAVIKLQGVINPSPD
jgi:signal transduction histidine kinase